MFKKEPSGVYSNYPSSQDSKLRWVQIQTQPLRNKGQLLSDDAQLS